MSNLKAIRRRLVSVSNTKQITRAMKLVSAAKLRRAQSAALGGRVYCEKLGSVLNAVLNELPEDFCDPLMERAEKVERRRIIVIAGERGLCGAYNTNIFRAIENEEQTSEAELEFVAMGKRAVEASRKFAWKTTSVHEGLDEQASRWPVVEIAGTMVEDFRSGKIQEVVVYYTKFISPMTQVVQREVLLPLAPQLPSSDDESTKQFQEIPRVKFDPSPRNILAELIPVVIRTKITQAGRESRASEHAARMTAMDSATRNANELIEKLRLHYNRARQSAITSELIDIVGGAEAQK